ncbi:MAG TPA: MFS transporter [Thermoplasmata archaeon]|jgi:MFS family permease|nr:MFS transporter [Thermoplasmata archaeon]
MAEGVGLAEGAQGTGSRFSMRYIVAAASSGTIIEWYDFYIFVTLGFILTPKFFAVSNDPTINFLSFLATYAAGFAVRPFGAVFFGRIGDLVGRKYAFLLTVTIMGVGTAAIGVMPEYSHIGLLAPTILVFLRLMQGLALGGEYGGAVIYVAEHAPDEKRGYWTSYIQTTATVGLFISIGVILGTQLGLGKATFADWGWRLPFLLSLVLVVISLYIRWKLKETPLFSRLKAAGRTSRTPLREALASKANWKLILLALLGATSGQAVVWYTGQFLALFVMQRKEFGLVIDSVTSNLIMFVALILATPFFIVFGKLSDRIGRKKIMMAGCLLAAVTYIPIYAGMLEFGKPLNVPVMTALVFIQVIYVTMVYGPIAAFLVEFFPARIRYTALSVPYHLGNGEFGGFTPFIVFGIIAATGNIYLGLSWVVLVPLMTFLIGMKWLPETKDTKIWEEVTPGPAFGDAPSTMRAGADVGTTSK